MAGPQRVEQKKGSRMARVTVEDCIEIHPNRFDLVVLAAQRSREISSGGELTLARDDDKNPVVALREFAAKSFTPEELRESLIHSLQKHVEVDEPEEDDMATLMPSDWVPEPEPKRPVEKLDEIDVFPDSGTNDSRMSTS